jgi:hypothetical protein
MTNSVVGITPDGWMTTSAIFNTFAPNGPRRGTAVVTLTRGPACNGLPAPHVTIRASRMRLNADSQPVPGRLLALRRVVVPTKPPCPTVTVRVPVSTPFILTATADRTFQPSQYDPRQLSAQAGFGFEPGAKR